MILSLSRWFRSRTVTNRGAGRKKTQCKLFLEVLEDRTVPSTIQGAVFDDANSNGVRDAGEVGLANWRVFLDLNRNGVLESGEPSVLTTPNGSYVLDTTDYPPSGNWPKDPKGNFLGLILQQGSGGRWMNTTATFVIADPVVEPDALSRNFGVRLQPFVGVGPIGPETLVNVTVAGQQGSATITQAPYSGFPVSVATDAAGNSVVTWTTFSDVGTAPILARVFNADGTPRTGELLVGTATGQRLEWMMMPQTAMAADGRFAVAWSSYDPILQAYSTYLRVYHADGTPVTPVVTVIQGTAKISGMLDAIAMNGNGDFAVMYDKSTYRGGYWEHPSILIQRYTRLGAVNGQVITLATPSLLTNWRSMAMDAAGNFVAVWTEHVYVTGKNDTYVKSIYAQRFYASGQKNGALIKVVALVDDPGNQQLMVWYSSVAMARDGRFVVTWQHTDFIRVAGTFSDKNQWKAQLFNANGTLAGGIRDVPVNAYAGPPLALAYDDAGNVTFAFTERRSPNNRIQYPYDSVEVRFRRLTAAGTFEPEMIVNTTTQGTQFRPGIAATGNGSFIVAWQGYGPGDNAGIFFQRYAPLNHAPVNTVPVAQTTNQDALLVFSTAKGNAITIADQDAGSAPVRVTLIATRGILTLNGTAGLTINSGSATTSETVTLTGTIASINKALNGLVFTPNPNYQGYASLRIITKDLDTSRSGGPMSDDDTIGITVGSVSQFVTSGIFTAPVAGYYSVICVGMGGAGQIGGGGGAAWASSAVYLSAGQQVPLLVADQNTPGNTQFGTMVVAASGHNAVGAMGGLPGSASDSVGDIRHSGGRGADAFILPGAWGGGGGGSGGYESDGTDATGAGGAPGGSPGPYFGPPYGSQNGGDGSDTYGQNATGGSGFGGGGGGGLLGGGAGSNGSIWVFYLSASPPIIGSLTASTTSVPAGNSVTLTATDVQATVAGSSITQVIFYLDSNNSGAFDSADAPLSGSISNSNRTWTLSFSTTGWAARNYKLFAQALDSSGVFSDPLELTIEVY